MTEKLNPIERALVAASSMPAPQSRAILKLICESGMTIDKPVAQEPTEGGKHYAKREKFIKRMKSSTDRVLNYARHETLRKIEKHFRANSALTSAEGDPPATSLAARLTFDKALLSEELLAALREDQEAALGTAGQQLFDEIGKDSVWRLPSQDALQFIEDRANLLANVPDEVHTEIMQSIEQGLQHGESRKELMARISTAFDEIGKSRAETIANTETAAAFNYSRDKAMREAGVTHKRWLHSMSPLIKEPRPTHLEADGQTVPIDEPFDVGGVQFMRPADDSLGAGPEDIINCHCVSIAVEAPIESGEGEGHPFHGNQYVTGFHGSAEIARKGKFEGGLRLDVSPSGRPRAVGETIDSMGTWFTTDKPSAEKYGRFFNKEGTGYNPGAVLEAQIHIKNPKVFTSETEMGNFFNSFRKKSGGMMLPPRGDEIMSHLKSLGHDGIILVGGERGYGGDYYLSFENQGVDIKQAHLPK